MNLLVIFVLLSIVNVIFSTIKSIVTIKGGAFTASLISALYYGYYNVVLIYTVADFPLWQKVLITFLCNLIGVFIVKWGEAKARKDKLWRVEATVPRKYLEAVHMDLKDIPHSYIDIEKYAIFNIYCSTQAESAEVKKIINQYGAKYFVAESRGEL